MSLSVGSSLKMNLPLSNSYSLNGMFGSKLSGQKPVAVYKLEFGTITSHGSEGAAGIIESKVIPTYGVTFSVQSKVILLS